jgi:hypothetical protein
VAERLWDPRVTTSILQRSISGLPALSFRNRPMRVFMPDEGLIGAPSVRFPFRFRGSLLYLVDAAVLDALVAGEIDAIAESIDAFRRWRQEFGGEDENAEPYAIFPDGTLCR